ncbi:nicolin-1 isoform X3 [Amia ocellicauda]|uniref:nicolin-1 isoform X3 n=1 Tax=Amia ocellicauda TaxID=2972642 RepID=UPI003463C35F
MITKNAVKRDYECVIMSDNTVTCTVKTPVALQIGDVKTDSRPGIYVIDITFPPGQTINMLVEPDDVTSIRLILRQPSSVWLNFTLEDIKIRECGNEDSEKNLSSWFSSFTPVEQPPDLKEGLPDPQQVSSSIQQMWALTEVMQTNQSAARIGRFDVDGCYDINLLSYT